MVAKLLFCSLTYDMPLFFFLAFFKGFYGSQYGKDESNAGFNSGHYRGRRCPVGAFPKKVTQNILLLMIVNIVNKKNTNQPAGLI